MSSLLWIISFLLHMIALLAIYKLLQQIQVLKQRPASESNIDSKLKHYIEEIRQENQNLQALIQKGATPDQKQQSNGVLEEFNLQEEPFSEQIKENFSSEDAEDTVEASLEAKVLQLYNQGKTIDEIASELECGKTEAEIIIKLHQKNV
ncbi:DUF6115 domain-containing protein [Oceanobacillus kimchii]|uniref:Swarming motility protein SwrB n=1 Tax=Oceanobacillus kimchii TaxID=746691 RepID=A0ABQ5TIW0_9BACI|nr:hypothetical protein [Oceanobacillus kimchii]GLO66022.1 hypothetical protein MACH08_18060 [Oceanobacillus kimchii]